MRTNSSGSPKPHSTPRILQMQRLPCTTQAWKNLFPVLSGCETSREAAVAWKDLFPCASETNRDAAVAYKDLFPCASETNREAAVAWKDLFPYASETSREEAVMRSLNASLNRVRTDSPQLSWYGNLNIGPESSYGQEVADWGVNKTGPGLGGRVEGESFYFRVNGVAMYMRGANLIPFDIVPTRVSRRNITRTLESALDANMNTIRICNIRFHLHGMTDYLAVLLLSEYTAEARFQIRRLGSHPSIVIWGGNNEVEVSAEWYEATKADRPLYASDYMHLWGNTLREAAEELDPGRAYVDGSPSNMIYSKDPYLKRWSNPQEPMYGDVHIYNYVPSHPGTPSDPTQSLRTGLSSQTSRDPGNL
eukprot:gene26907-4523_t